MFSLCPPLRRGGGFPVPGLDGWEYPIPGLDGGGGYPIPDLDRGGYSIPGLDGEVPHPRSGWGVARVPPISRMGYPLFKSQVRMGVSPHHQDGVPPVSRMEYTPSRSGQGWGTPTVTAWRVLAMRRAACLLRSRRRTFLFVHLFSMDKIRNEKQN